MCSPGDAATSGVDLILAEDSKRRLFNRLSSELCETEMCPGASLQKDPPAYELWAAAYPETLLGLDQKKKKKGPNFLHLNATLIKWLCLHKPSADQGDTPGLAAEQQCCTFTGRNVRLSFPATPCLHSQPPAKQTVLQISLQITPRLANPPESAANPEPCAPCPHTGSPLLRGGCLLHSELQLDSPCVFLFRIKGGKTALT